MSLKFCIIIDKSLKRLFSLLFCTPTWLPWRHMKTENKIQWYYQQDIFCTKASPLLFLVLLNIIITTKLLITIITTNNFCSLKKWLSYYALSNWSKLIFHCAGKLMLTTFAITQCIMHVKGRQTLITALKPLSNGNLLLLATRAIWGILDPSHSFLTVSYQSSRLSKLLWFVTS